MSSMKKNSSIVSAHARLLVLAIAITINIFNISSAFSMEERVNYLRRHVNNSVHRVNESMALAHNANGASIRAFERANEVLETVNDLTERIENITEDVEEAEQRVDAAKRARDVKEKIQLEKAKIREKHRQGIYEQTEKIRAQASVEVEAEKWNKIQEIFTDPKTVLNMFIGITLVALSFYTIKHGIPAFMHHITRPRVISETSTSNWFESDPERPISIDDLIFAPALQKKLIDLALRIESAQTYHENLPNILLYGASGTGKTTLVKALAYFSGLDYAFTSGSEFTKITNLDVANNELRNLLNWAKKSDRGLIVFIDEAESLFANRKLPTTTKATQDFINTFLALVSDASQKNVMFVFATNHPFKLDDALIDRIGLTIELPLPEAPEREKILDLYLGKFAQENEEARVTVNPEVVQALPTYAENLKGLSPRALKFVAEEMIVAARRERYRQLTPDIAQKVLAEAKHNLQETERWQQEREQWAQAFRFPQIPVIACEG